MRDKVLALMGEAGVNNAGLARAIGMDDSAFGKWLNGRKATPPKVEYVLAMARSLGVSVDYLVDDAMDSPPCPPPSLPEDEMGVLRLYRALKGDPDQRMDMDEALRRLSRKPNTPPKIEPSDPQPQRGGRDGGGRGPGPTGRGISARANPSRRQEMG